VPNGTPAGMKKVQRVNQQKKKGQIRQQNKFEPCQTLFEKIVMTFWLSNIISESYNCPGGGYLGQFLLGMCWGVV